MRAYELTTMVALGAVAAGVFAVARAAPKEPPAPEPIELSGRLRRPVKWSPQLELVPAGQVTRFDLRGNLLEGLKDGTPIRVKGVVRSSLHRGGTAANPSPFPPQWTLWLEVTDLKVLSDPLDVLTAEEKK